MSLRATDRKRRLPSSLATIVALLAVACSQAAGVSFSSPIEAGRLTAPPRNEASGLAASCRAPDLLWTHDDSGGEPVLYAIATNGATRGRLRVNGVKNFDWEDIASGELDGKPCLVIGDVGDNFSVRTNLALHIVEEPPPETLSPTTESTATPLATLRLSFADGPRDCECVALDVKERAIYLLSKRDAVPRLYRVALPGELKSGDVRATFVGFVPRLPQPSKFEKLLMGPRGKYRGEPTGMDFAADGSAAIVLTYGDLSWFERRAGETWADALARDPIVLPAHLLPQAEGVCFTRDAAHIFVVSEAVRALLRYDRR